MVPQRDAPVERVIDAVVIAEVDGLELVLTLKELELVCDTMRDSEIEEDAVEDERGDADTERVVLLTSDGAWDVEGARVTTAAKV